MTEKYNLLIEESGEFLEINQPNSIIINSNEREAILELTTLEDDDFNPQSQVKVTILAGELYTIANEPHNSAVVTVADRRYTLWSISNFKEFLSYGG